MSISGTAKNALTVGSSSNAQASYVERGLGPYFNLSMRLESHYENDRLVDIVPANFGASLVPHGSNFSVSRLSVIVPWDYEGRLTLSKLCRNPPSSCSNMTRGPALAPLSPYSEP